MDFIASAKAASIRSFWPGYWRMRISRAAAAAAASAEAFGSVGSSGMYREYRFCTELTASDIDTFTRAMLRVHGLPPTLTAFITSMAVLFQSAMTSARTSVLPDIRARPTIAAFSTFIVASFSENRPPVSRYHGREPVRATCEQPHHLAIHFAPRLSTLSG